MTASVIGLTAVLVAFEPAFLAVRQIGSAYLIVLGLRLLFSRDHGPSEDRSSPQRVDSRRASADAWPPNPCASDTQATFAAFARGPRGPPCSILTMHDASGTCRAATRLTVAAAAARTAT